MDSVSGDDELYENFVDDVSAEMDSADETNSESSGDVVVSDNDMDEHRLSEDDDNEPNFPVFNPVEMYNPSLELGMIFCSKKEFKKAVQSYAIKQKRSVKFTKNDSFRVYAVCSGDGCKWKIHANKLKNEETFQINLYQDEHTCPQVFNVRNVKTSWLKIKRTELRDRHKKLEGSPEQQFTKLWDYAEELRRTNPGSTIILGVNDVNRVDPNNNLYPIAYSVVQKESRDTWEWFLTVLKQDLCIQRDNEYTFMSDKQGLIQAFQGLAYKNALWKAARASTVGEFKLRMEEMKQLNQDAFDWFNDKPPTEWSKSHFNEFPKCDILLNNCCESFNGNIMDARDKPILTMLEWIREYLMRRLQENREKTSKKWKDTLCPKIKKLLQKNVDKIGDCIPIKANDRHYQISCYDGNQYSVDLEMRTCTCRIWQLSAYLASMPAVQFSIKTCSLKTWCTLTTMLTLTSKCMSMQYFQSVGRHCGVRQALFHPCLQTLEEALGDLQEQKTGSLMSQMLKQKKSCKKPIKLKRQKVKHHCKICGEEGHNAKGCALWKDMQEPGLDQEVMDSLFSAHPTQEQRGASSSNHPRKRKHSVYQDPTRMNMTAAASGVSDQPHILPPIVEDNEPTEIELTPEILTEAGPSQTQASVQGPTMFEQLQMAHTSMPVQPQMTLQPRLNIRAPPPMTGIGVMPCFSSRPLIPVSKTIIKEHGKKFVDLSKWPSQSAKDHQQK
ncbi:UNVERIFIED_CONTAM: hypothetical protein Sangu_1858300 [Sesamum angustifolium]|uniref:CCHC-type domain-containing protein n=1 Tax=Sesamum angustifolium TaxID=2727405 RepID=A0AAW2MBI3_9LAMI